MNQYRIESNQNLIKSQACESKLNQNVKFASAQPYSVSECFFLSKCCLFPLLPCQNAPECSFYAKVHFFTRKVIGLSSTITPSLSERCLDFSISRLLLCSFALSEWSAALGLHNSVLINLCLMVGRRVRNDR